MATNAAAAPEAAIPPNDAEPTILPARVVEAYESMIESVPESGGDGMASILDALAQATDAADLDAPWRTAGLESWLNVPLQVRGIRKVPSDFGGGLPWFLVLDAVVVPTGELVTITTGAVSVVAQLVKAHAIGAFPLTVIPRQSDRPSKNGYYPQHLEIAAPGRGA